MWLSVRKKKKECVGCLTNHIYDLYIISYHIISYITVSFLIEKIWCTIWYTIDTDFFLHSEDCKVLLKVFFSQKKIFFYVSCTSAWMNMLMNLSLCKKYGHIFAV